MASVAGARHSSVTSSRTFCALGWLSSQLSAKRAAFSQRWAMANAFLESRHLVVNQTGRPSMPRNFARQKGESLPEEPVLLVMLATEKSDL
jgi:hypothetical protein